ncbi:hypothetical protein SDC9_116857 [bioreactor metagenome]|uniref:N-acetyltransferase domain-containing protein n=1 Tax=bioreactor metagenome TaxID=1076179 RepID=A0A645BWY5_9ZZZZ
MHIRIGLPYVIKERTEEERAAERKDYKDNQKSYYVLEDNGIIIGIGGLFDDNSGMGMLAVDRTYVGKGYGTKLAAYITNECIRRGCKNPCTYCESNNANAMHIYKKIGYVEKSRESVALHH